MFSFMLYLKIEVVDGSNKAQSVVQEHIILYLTLLNTICDQAQMCKTSQQ